MYVCIYIYIYIYSQIVDMTHCFKSFYPEYFANNQTCKIIESNIFHFLVNTFLCCIFVPVVFLSFSILFYFLFLSMFLVNTFFLFLSLFYLSKPWLQYNVTFYCCIIVTLLFYYCYMLFMLLYINTNTWNHLYVTIIFYYIYVFLYYCIFLYICIYIWGTSEIEIQILDKRLDFALILNPSYEKILKISPGEYLFDGSSEISLLKIFLINQRFALNLTGNLFLVILVWNFFLSQLEK